MHIAHVQPLVGKVSAGVDVEDIVVEGVLETDPGLDTVEFVEICAFPEPLGRDHSGMGGGVSDISPERQFGNDAPPPLPAGFCALGGI